MIGIDLKTNNGPEPMDAADGERNDRMPQLTKTIVYILISAPSGLWAFASGLSKDGDGMLILSSVPSAIIILRRYNTVYNTACRPLIFTVVAVGVWVRAERTGYRQGTNDPPGIVNVNTETVRPFEGVKCAVSPTLYQCYNTNAALSRIT
jgi:hypothetical protein